MFVSLFHQSIILIFVYLVGSYNVQDIYVYLSTYQRELFYFAVKFASISSGIDGVLSSGNVRTSW